MPWRELLAAGRLFSNLDAPETCEDDELSHVLMTGWADDARLLGLARMAGCRALENTESDAVRGPYPGRPVCCRSGVPAAPSLATGGGRSCARALFDQVTVEEVSDAAAGRESPGKRYGGVLEEGTFLADCRVPSSVAVVICVAAVQGRVQGVSVAMRPFDVALADCVASRVRALRLPASGSMGVTITRFAPETP